ncbi:DUF3592 domain-containing protein [Streptomyces odontomachi]|uniref:DUF3592 domain-containing protein n=1 Tax=Streptomyces odontomachi TaxID=2944940 RepID=UPI002108B1D9|nr:DUF3592 domain-containing protein [Streptomyces sp. ODS25]
MLPTAVFAAVPYVLAALPFLLGALCLYGGLSGLRHANRLRRTGVRAEGEVVRIEENRHGDVGSSRPQYPVVSWTTSDGTPMETRSPIGVSHAPRFQPGARITLHYDPSDPAANWAIDGFGTTSARIGIAVGTVLVAFGLWLAWLMA